MLSTPSSLFPTALNILATTYNVITVANRSGKLRRKTTQKMTIIIHEEETEKQTNKKL